ncbi:MAG TPA: FtsW/RodA/SpoVE family cell cycle protein, partial [Candidatus Limnocylindrales bacterium]
MSGRDRWDDEDPPLGRERVSRSSGPSRPSEASRSQTSILANPNAMKREAHEPDYIIIVAVLALSAIGILMVYSASAIDSYRNSQNTFQLVAPQVVAGLLGLVAMLILMRIDYRYLRVASVPLAILSLVLLVVVLVPGPWSVSNNGS